MYILLQQCPETHCPLVPAHGNDDKWWSGESTEVTGEVENSQWKHNKFAKKVIINNSLVVEPTHLKEYACQIGSSPQVGVKIKN